MGVGTVLAEAGDRAADQPRVDRPQAGVVEPVSGQAADGYSFALRVIPSPEEDAPPSLAELIRIHTINTVKEEWEGTGWLEFFTHSDVDPWHQLPVREVVDARYRIADMTLGFGKVIKRF